jgi:hypothetical protein
LPHNRLMKYFLFFLLILNTAFASAQQVQVKGKVTDQNDEPVPGANVVIVSGKDSTVFFGTVTNASGNFDFPSIPRDRYLMRISFIGFEKIEKPVFAFAPITNVETVKMAPASKELKALEVQEIQTRVEQKGDTTQFNADSYKVNKDASAEDLVTKMPGITIENGTIKAQGENIRQVWVDGKPFFGDDPNLALKNLPAEIISQVQVYDRASDQSRFTGVNDGNTSKAINIITKQGRNNGTFGRILAGYGTDDRYNAGATLNFFKGSRRLTLLAISNNINRQNFSPEDLNPGGGGGGQSPMGGGMWRRPGGGNDNLMVNQQNGITTTHAFGINYTDQWTKKITATGSYFFNQGDNNRLTYLNRSFFAENLGLYGDTTEVNNLNMTHRASMRLEFIIDSANSVIWTPRANIQSGNSSSVTNALFGLSDFNSKTFNEITGETAGYSVTNGILYRRKFQKEKRTFSINLDTDVRDNNNFRDQSSLNQFLAMEVSNAVDLRSELITKSSSNSGNITYTEPISEKSLIQFSYQPSYAKSLSNRLTTNRDFANDVFVLDTALSNVFENRYLSNRGGASYVFNTEKLNFNAGLNYQRAELSGNRLFPGEELIERTFINLLPEAMLFYKFSDAVNYRLRYRTSTSAPNVAQLQNVIDNSNPIILSSGNENLRQSYNHNIFTRFGKTNTAQGKSFFLFLFGSTTQDFISNELIIARNDTTLSDGTQLLRGTQLTRPVNVNGFYNTRVYTSYGVPIKQFKSNLNLNTGVSLTRTPSIINQTVNFANNFSVNSGFTLGSNISEKIDFTVSYSGNYSMVRNSLQQGADNNFLIQNTSAKIDWTTRQGIIIHSNITHSLFTGLKQEFNQSFLLWNAALAYKVLKDKSLEVRLSVFDLLGQNLGINRTVTETFIEDTSTNVLQRYFMLTLTYNIRKFKSPERVK